MQCNKFLCLNLLRLILAATFIYLFGSRVVLLASKEKANRITFEKGDLIFPSINICPSYNSKYNDSMIINLKDNYTLEDVEQLPSLLTVIQPQLELWQGYDKQ